MLILLKLASMGSPYLLKPSQLYPPQIITASPITQLHHSTMDFYRDIKANKSPGMLIFGLTSLELIWSEFRHPLPIFSIIGSPGNRKHAPSYQSQSLEYLDDNYKYFDTVSPVQISIQTSIQISIWTVRQLMLINNNKIQKYQLATRD